MPSNFPGRAARLALSVAGLVVLGLSDARAGDPIKRLLDLQLKKGIITQQEYEECLAEMRDGQAAPIATSAPAPALLALQAPVPAPAPAPAPAVTRTPAAPGEGGITLLSKGGLKVEVFGTVDLAVGYTSQSLVPSGEMPTSIGPYISGGVKYPATGGYPQANMSGQTGLFNSALSTSAWGIRASRELGGSGLKAFVLLDSAFNPATGQLVDQAHNESVNSKYPTTAYATSSLNGQLFSREAYVGLSDDSWGRLTFGRNNNLLLDVLNRYAPLQKAGLFTPYGNGVYGGGGGISENARVDNSLKYQLRLANWNFALEHGFGGAGGLKKGAEGNAVDLGYETERLGVQVVYEEFKDLFKTSVDATVANVIDLTAYDQRALLLAGKYRLGERAHLQVGYQVATLNAPTADVNIGNINSIYGDTVNAAKTIVYAGGSVKVKTYHLGFDYDITDRLNLGAALVYIDLPAYRATYAGATPYLGGNIENWTALAIYKLYEGTDIYAGLLYTHYQGPAFQSDAKFVYVRNITTAATGIRFRF